MNSILNNNKILICLTLSCLFVSCASLRKTELSGDEIELTNDNIKLLNGTYNRYSEDTTWCALVHNDLGDNLYLISHKGDRVNISVHNNRSIRVTLLNESDTIKSKVFRGKIEYGYFNFRRRVKVIPVILGNVFWNGKTRIGLLNNGNITVDSRKVLFGHILFFPAIDSEKAYGVKHTKIN